MHSANKQDRKWQGWAASQHCFCIFSFSTNVLVGCLSISEQLFSKQSGNGLIVINWKMCEVAFWPSVFVGHAEVLQPPPTAMKAASEWWKNLSWEHAAFSHVKLVDWMSFLQATLQPPPGKSQCPTQFVTLVKSETSQTVDHRRAALRFHNSITVLLLGGDLHSNRQTFIYLNLI